MRLQRLPRRDLSWRCSDFSCKGTGLLALVDCSLTRDVVSSQPGPTSFLSRVSGEKEAIMRDLDLTEPVSLN